MSPPESHDDLLEAFEAIAAARDAITPACVTPLLAALRRTANDMRDGGRPIERVVAHVKALATEAGIRDSHAHIVTEAVLSVIEYYYGENRFDTWTNLVAATGRARMRLSGESRVFQ